MTKLSNSNTSKSINTTAINTAPLFKVGDVVLCPMTVEWLKSYVLTTDPYKQNNLVQCLNKPLSQSKFDKVEVSL